MINLIHQRTHPQTIAQQNKLILKLRALLPRSREVLDRLCPFLVGGLDLPSEGVEVVDEACEDLERAGVWTELGMQGVDMVCYGVVRAFLCKSALSEMCGGGTGEKWRDVRGNRDREGGPWGFRSRAGHELPCPRTAGPSSSRRSTSCSYHFLLEITVGNEVVRSRRRPGG